MKTQIWAHRGASAYAPENTLEAFDLAVKQHADGVELDVQMTKDERLVVIHDEMIERVSDGKGRVADYTLSELKKLHFNRTQPSYPDARIPELREVYDLLRHTDLVVNVEIKTGIVLYPGIEKLVLEETKQMGFQERTIFSSFHHQSLLTLKRLDPTTQTGILYSDGWLNIVSYAKTLKADALHPAWYHLQIPAWVHDAKSAGLKVHVWTVDNEKRMERMSVCGVNSIITNRPDVCRQVLQVLNQS